MAGQARLQFMVKQLSSQDSVGVVSFDNNVRPSTVVYEVQASSS